MVPRSAPLIAGCLALVIAFGDAVGRPPCSRTAACGPALERSEPVVVFGAGNAGRQIVRTMLRSPDSPYRPVALLDDDPQKSRLHIEGVRVQGTRRDIVTVAKSHDGAAVRAAGHPVGHRRRCSSELTTSLVEAG